MNLAPPAPTVESASAAAILPDSAGPAIVNMVQQGGSVRVSVAQAVDPAVPFDNPRVFAPAPQPEVESTISVAALREAGGSDFESYAAILRGAPEKNFLKTCLPCIYDERDFVSFGEARKYALIKGASCFVFNDDTDPSPLYAIPLNDLYTILEDPDKPDPGSVTISPELNTNKPRKGMVTVLLKYKNNSSQAFQFTFDTLKDPSLPNYFIDAVDKAGKKAGSIPVSIVEDQKTDKEMKN